MTSRAIVCTFSGAIADLKPKDRGNTKIVLQCLKDHPRFSTFDATEHKVLAQTLDYLKDHLLIKYRDWLKYPWHEVDLTEKGLEYLRSAE